MLISMIEAGIADRRAVLKHFFCFFSALAFWFDLSNKLSKKFITKQAESYLKSKVPVSCPAAQGALTSSKQ